MERKSAKEIIIKQLKEKSCMKQDIFHNTSLVFNDLKDILQNMQTEYRKEIDDVDSRIQIGYKSKGTHEAHFRFAGDVLVFHMHTNVFTFDKNHQIWKTSYVKKEESRAYCGMINVYNFLSDSIKYNRINDSGYLVARIFINKDNHYFVEGKRQLGYLYNDFMNSNFDKENIKKVLESAMLYTIDFDLLTPPYDEMKEITVYESQELTNNISIKTGKRLGFKFEADRDVI